MFEGKRRYRESFQSTLLHVKKYKHCVKKQSVDLHQELISLNNSKKVNGLDCYFQRYIMRVRRRCENYSKHDSRATNNILLLFDF